MKVAAVTATDGGGQSNAQTDGFGHSALAAEGTVAARSFVRSQDNAAGVTEEDEGVKEEADGTAAVVGAHIEDELGMGRTENVEDAASPEADKVDAGRKVAEAGKEAVAVAAADPGDLDEVDTAQADAEGGSGASDGDARATAADGEGDLAANAAVDAARLRNEEMGRMGWGHTVREGTETVREAVDQVGSPQGVGPADQAKGSRHPADRAVVGKVAEAHWKMEIDQEWRRVLKGVARSHHAVATCDDREQSS